MNDKNDLEGKRLLVVEQGLLQEEFYVFLQECGMQVERFDLSHNLIYKYGSLKDKIKNIFQRLVFKNENYLQDLNLQFLNKLYISRIKQFKKENITKNFDYILVVRPDNFTLKTLKMLPYFGNVISGFMWDGIGDLKAERLKKSRFIFKDLYCFDNDDLAKFPDLKLKFITNFFYPSEIRKNKIAQNPLKLSYIGSATQDNRGIYLKHLADHFIDSKYSVDFKLFKINTSQDLEVKNGKLSYLSVQTSYDEYLNGIASSLATFDLKLSYHKGLSFRVFEAMYYGRKLITTNPIVRKFDFYEPNNILILEDGNDLKSINEFLEKPYVNLPIEIINKYRADNWMRNVFAIGNYSEIKYPK